jgi:multidrug efflux pump subunit AcrA (membrane-fusion protein)
MKKIHVLTVGLLLLTGGGGWLIFRSQGVGEKQDGERENSARGPERGKTIAVFAQEVQQQMMPHTIEMVSVLEGRQQALVYSHVAGRIAFIGPEEGQAIKQGDLLFRVDRSDPGKSFLATPIVSPITGWVGRWLVRSIGSQVGAQEPVVSVVNDTVLHGRIQLPTAQWLQVSSTTTVRARIGSTTRPAQVISISRAAESSSSRGTITVGIANDDHSWKAGMVAEVSFDLDYQQRMVVPASALSVSDQGAFVFTVVDATAQRTAVKFFVLDNDRVEITSGLQPGQQVITQGVNQVGDGIAVKVVEENKGL